MPNSTILGDATGLSLPAPTPATLPADGSMDHHQLVIVPSPRCPKDPATGDQVAQLGRHLSTPLTLPHISGKVRGSQRLMANQVPPIGKRPGPLAANLNQRLRHQKKVVLGVGSGVEAGAICLPLKNPLSRKVIGAVPVPSPCPVAAFRVGHLWICST